MKRIVFIACILAGVTVRAQPVDLATAEMAAQAWAVTSDTLGVEVGERIEKATEHTTDNGAKFYTVKMDGGTIVMTSDDELEPVLAFTDGDADWTELDRESPMWAFLNRHISGMAIALTNQPALKLATVQPPTSNLQPATASQKRWAALIEKGKEIKKNGLPKMSDTWRRDADITDLRVPALCRTKWQQYNSGYNYYTPNNYACGCVATAQAQIMRKHCWPTGEVEKVSKWCSVDGYSKELTTQGGVFDWANMPFSGGHTEIQRQAVGKLCSDVGITLNMSYSKGGSGSTTPKVMYSLVNNFQYAGAVCLQYAYNAFGEYGEEWPKSRRECLERIFFTNFDAGLPVCVGVPGHEIVADGYGFIDDLEYVHFNFGWAGISTCWYYIPDLTGAGSEYSYVDDLVYNIMPTNYLSEAIVSGRVLDHNGKPLSGVRVKMAAGKDDARATAGEALDETVTNERGIWSFIVRAGDWIEQRTDDYVTRTTRKLDFTVEAFGNFKSAKAENVSLDCPVNYRLYYYTSDKPSKLGNSWGNDIQLELDNPDYPEVENNGATFENHTVGDTRVIDEDDNGKLAKESYDGKFWWAQDGEGVVHICSEIIPHAESSISEQNMHYASFTGVVYRAIHNTYDAENVAATNVTEFVPEEIGTDGFVFDAMVRLEEVEVEGGGGQWMPLLPDDDLKIAVMAKGGALVVIAGDGKTDHSTVCYETGIAIDTDTMHRLTIKASSGEDAAALWGQSALPGFLVWLDGAFVGSYPSRIIAGSEAQQVRTMGFAGRGVDADNVYTTRTMPPFEEPVVITIPNADHMTTSVKDGGTEIAPLVAGGTQYSVMTGVTLTVTYTPEAGWYPSDPVVKSLKVENAGSTIPPEELPTVHGPYAKTGGVLYGTLEEAIAACATNGTVILTANFTNGTTQVIDKNMTLDMNEMRLHNSARVGFKVKDGAKLIVTGVGVMSGDILFFVDWGAEVEIRNGDFSDCEKVILRSAMWYLK